MAATGSSGSAGADLRAAIESPGITVLPGAYDVVSARLAERAGFEAVFTSGYGLAASRLGLPDLGLMTASENLDAVRSIAGRLSVPVVADMDTGYGNALNTRRTVEACLDAGVAGVFLEDQVWPKRCGHMTEKRVVPAGDHAARIRAARDARADRDDDLVIVGRTDAREPHGLEDAIERGRIYRDAGADVVFIEAPRSREELATVADSFDTPTLANMVEGGRTPFLAADELESIGFDAVVFPLSGLLRAAAAVRGTYDRLSSEGRTDPDRMLGFEAFEGVVRTGEYRSLEARYDVGR